MITYGNPDRHLSFTLYRYWRQGEHGAFYSVGGAWRVNPRVTMITEHWGYSRYQKYMQRTSVGFRRWSKRTSFDLAAQGVFQPDFFGTGWIFRVEPQFGFSLNLSRSKL